DGSLAMSAHLADVIVGEVEGAWCVLDTQAHEVASLDLTRRVARLDAPMCTRTLDDVTTERVQQVAAVLFAAEAIGIAQWCVDTAADYAKVRVQFGRPIGQFQGVKHRCAEMLARTELARAAVWDAARAAHEPGTEGAALAVAAAAALAFD